MRALFTHHPDYADLTPVQYADGLTWLRRAGLLSSDGRPVVHVSGSGLPDCDAASRIARVLWDPAAQLAHQETGTAGELAVLRLLRECGAAGVRHVAALSDAYGYDIEAAEGLSGETAHIEVKTTTDPTRLVIHLSRHEYEVMCEDSRWLMAAVLLGADASALNVMTVSREWLRSVAPQDQHRNGHWESARFVVPAHALTRGIAGPGNGWLVPAEASPHLPVWGWPLVAGGRQA
ncbi:DUF3883 domain-containing protein [Streptomyces sp. NPDC093595]|uniref:DUF3883 domain-containing protein n=1 Tax=Streptomyces sp. NPDC093595 TaxID=3366045 RepID=UPI0037F6D8B3